MSDSLVPISYKIDLDKIATEFLRKHYPEALRTPVPVDPMVLADRLGLSVITHELTENFSVFGQLFFQDCDSEVYNSATGEMETAHFPAKTIAVDPKAFHLRNYGFSRTSSFLRSIPELDVSENTVRVKAKKHAKR